MKTLQKPQFPALTPIVYGLSSLGLSLCLGMPALAETSSLLENAPSSYLNMEMIVGSYIPPEESRVGGSSTGGGPRTPDCPEMIALAPAFNHIGQTPSTRPTLVWYMAFGSQFPLQVSVSRIQPGSSASEPGEVVFTDLIEQSHAGFNAYTVLDSQMALEPGASYRWRVSCYPDEELKQEMRWIEAEMDVVAPPAVIEDVASLNDPVAQAEAYAAAGFWFDAIARVYKGDTPAAQALRTTLIQDLAELDRIPNNQVSIVRSDRLQQIIAQ